MSLTTWLDGKVTRQKLASLIPPVPPDAPRLKRLMLPQGELAQFHDGEEGMRYVASVELKPGTVRGNHYHEKKREWFYMISGELFLIVQDLDSGIREQINLKPGDLVYISPKVAHAFQVQAPGYAVEFSPVAFDAADTYRAPLITPEHLFRR